MLPAFIRRSIHSKAGISFDYSTKYKLSQCHAKFFYNKVLYVQHRYLEIQDEMIRRDIVQTPPLNLRFQNQNVLAIGLQTSLINVQMQNVFFSAFQKNLNGILIMANQWIGKNSILNIFNPF